MEAINGVVSSWVITIVYIATVPLSYNFTNATAEMQLLRAYHKFVLVILSIIDHMCYNEMNTMVN